MATDFEREAMILSEFDHPNIVRLYGVGFSTPTFPVTFVCPGVCGGEADVSPV